MHSIQSSWLAARHAEAVLFVAISFMLADQWGQKAIGRKTTGTGRMRYLKDMPRRFKNGFQEVRIAPDVATGNALGSDASYDFNRFMHMRPSSSGWVTVARSPAPCCAPCRAPRPRSSRRKQSAPPRCNPAP
eukprot:349682-Chlamydomonas_euryale.AAC.22